MTSTAAALWTDGRYFLQAESQLGPDWTLMRAGTPGVPEIHEWLAITLPPGARVGIDPTLHTIEAAEKLEKQLRAAGRVLVPLSANPVDAVWGEDRPEAPSAQLRVHPLEWAGASVEEKLKTIRNDLESAGVGALAVTMLDEVAWLFNLRGGDVSYNPVFVSYALVTKDGAALYVDVSKIGDAPAQHLKESGVEVKPYQQAFEDVKRFAKEGVRIWMDPAKVSYAMKMVALEASGAMNNTTQQQEKSSGSRGTRKRGRNSSGNGTETVDGTNAASSAPIVLEKTSPVGQAKAVKNEKELAGMREAHVRDGVALANFFCWLEKTVRQPDSGLTECVVDEYLTAQRAAQPGFIEPSFPTIAGAGPNGAVIHYRPLPETCRTVDASTLLLVDSGGQYDCGTTDVTRTVHLGQPSAHQKAAFTAVLKGHIALDTAVWPEGTPGCALDTLARTALWRMGLNYRHGTGHGVGAALNVHEGPQSISARFWNTQPLLPAMVCSNEPGYYEDGAFGVRIENLFVIEEANTPFRYAGQSYYTCRRLTLCPLQKKMIDKDALSPEEVVWVNEYHKEVAEALAPRLEAEGAEEALAWLREATSPL